MPNSYNTHEIVNMFRSIVELISQYPELLSTPGVFRVAGMKEETESLLTQMLKEQFNVTTLNRYVMEENNINSLHLNNVLGMIPIVFKESQILDPADDLVVIFTKELRSLLDSQKEEELKNIKTARLIDNFIHDLLCSNKIEHQRAGEILYHYSHLMHKAGTLQNSNLMTYKNLVIIMVPHFIHQLGLCPETDFLGLANWMNQLSPGLEHYITGERCAPNFKEQHADKLEHLANSRHSILKQLELMKEASNKVVTEPMQDLMRQASLINTQIGTIEEQQREGSLKKKEKKKLNQQCEQLKEARNILKLKISELSIEISVMNHRHKKIHEEISRLTHSAERVTTVKKERDQESIGVALDQFGFFESSGNPDKATFLSSIPEELEALENSTDLEGQWYTTTAN